MRPLIRRLVSPFVQLREGEGTTAALMFAYSFLAMTAYNIIKPVTRSKFISDLGADNLPWVQLAAGLLIGVVMHGYSRVIGRVPKRWAIPVTQAGLVALLLVLWFFFIEGFDAASVGLYVLGQILGILLISQFWTLANDIYDARHAKRLFGLIGGGASIGGAMGAGITATIVDEVGTVNLLLVASAVMLLCIGLVLIILRRESAAGTSSAAETEAGVGGTEAISLLRNSRHLQLIAVIIGCAAIGGAIVEQQLNMAAEASLGQSEVDGITQLLAQVTVYLSLIGFAIQVLLTSRIHGLLGIGFALLILPVGLGGMGIAMLLNSALWVPAAARVLDTSLRYTVDKTTREILFLPLPAGVKHRAKPFIDVTMDRFAKAVGALLLLVLIKPWGLALTWRQLSYASLALMAVWAVMAVKARREYLASFRRSLIRHDVAAADIRAPHADLQTVELLVEELAHPEESRVLYAIDLLESLGKRHLVTPLLLHHGSGAVRARALQAVGALKPDLAIRWLPMAERLLVDDHPDVRVSAARAVAIIKGQDATTLMRDYLAGEDPRLAITAAVVLSDVADQADQDAAADALRRLADDSREEAAAIRLEVARALADVTNTRIRRILIPLVLDADVEVARAAIASTRRSADDRALYLPALVSLLGNRRLKDDARDAILGYGDHAIGVLVHFLNEEGEDLWVRRRIPATLAHFPSQTAMDSLVATLSSADGFMRYKTIAAIESLHRRHPGLTVSRERLDALTLDEARRFFNAHTLHASMKRGAKEIGGTLLARALDEKQQRTLDRIFRLLALMYPAMDLASVWSVLKHGDARQRAGAAEYLDNVVAGSLRKRVLLMVEEMPDAERLRQISALFGLRVRAVDDTLAQLIHDDDPVMAAAAIHFTAATGRWELADDLEFVKTHRVESNWCASDTATWALSTRTALAGERGEGLSPLPTVALADQLRRLSMFDYVSVDELFRFAGTARQARYERGRHLYRGGVQPDTLEFLVEGSVQTEGGDRINAPAALGFEQILAGAPMHAGIQVIDGVVSLSLTREECLTLLSDNVDMARGVFKMLGETRGGFTGGAIASGQDAFEPVRAVAAGLPRDHVRLLHRHALFSVLSPAQMLPLAALAREVPVEAGSTLPLDAGNPAICFVAQGALSVSRPDGSIVIARPGDAVGLYEALGGSGSRPVITATTPGIVLKIDAQDLFALLASDLTFLRAVFAGALRTEGLGQGAPDGH
ncbi:MAG: Npt1/Npt2 family nucleotide transporter [Vicinamibacterales bacterium]